MHRVTVRIKKDLYDLYQIYLVENEFKMKDDITKHIREQVRSYRLPNNYENEYSNMVYSKLNFAIDTELYKQYKIVMIKNNTTPTADIIRYIQEIVEK